MKPASYPPAAPTGYAGRGVRNRPTVDVASPAPLPGLESDSDGGYVSDSVRGVASALDPNAAPWRRLRAAMREYPVAAFAAAIACGWLLGAGTRRRRRRARVDE
ncbi:hypothetical protein ABU614_19670 [Lysobacter firmicutimachus]|uniref:Uncharacterized protein n=1 Tax=Lysobacter firmicutimachus TaxID=1792846 RepID=A0AAU8MPX7_9GAMM